jgi:hypothetical protein
MLPPERGLLPEAALADEQELERDAVEPSERHDVMRNAEARGEGGAVAIVPVKQLDHPAGLAEGANPLVNTLAVDRVDDPDPPVCQQSVRRSLHPPDLDPAEAPLALVAKAGHG